MNALAPYAPPTINFNAKALANIRAMCPREITDEEFDRFIDMNRAKGLDPRLGHTFLFLFNADKAERRTTVTVVSETGYLAAADRCRAPDGTHIFLPDNELPVFEIDEKAKDQQKNPLGLVSATVAVKKFVQGEWHRIPAQVFWDERAPLVERWAYDNEAGKKRPTGEFFLDQKKTGWSRQPRNMLAKCARIAAARYAFPDQLGGLYFAEETAAIERGTLMTASEQVRAAIREEQLDALGAKESIMFDFGEGLAYVPLGVIHDRMEAFMRDKKPEIIRDFVERNRTGIKEFHVKRKGEWVDLLKRFVSPAASALKEREIIVEAEKVPDERNPE